MKRFVAYAASRVRVQRPLRGRLHAQDRYRSTTTPLSAFTAAERVAPLEFMFMTVQYSAGIACKCNVSPTHEALVLNIQQIAPQRLHPLPTLPA